MSDFRKLQSIKIEQLEKENKSLNSDLKEAEGAVADLMTLNDTLTGEVERLAEELEDSDAKADSWESSFLEAQLKAENKRLDMCLFSNTEPSQSYKDLEAEVERLREALGVIATRKKTGGHAP